MASPIESFNYRGAIEIADRLITRFGAYGSIRHEGVDYQCLIVTPSHSTRDRNAALEQMASVRCYMSVTGIPFTPSVYDVVTLPNGDKRRIRTCFPMRPAATTVFFELQIESS